MNRKPGALAVAGALADLSPFPRLGALALAPLPQGGVIRFRLELSPLRGIVLDLQCGAYMPLPELVSLLRRTADRIEAISNDHPQPTPDSPTAATGQHAEPGPSPTPPTTGSPPSPA